MNRVDHIIANARQALRDKEEFEAAHPHIVALHGRDPEELPGEMIGREDWDNLERYVRMRFAAQRAEVTLAKWEEAL